MAIEHPNAHVTGIDMADMFPTTIRPENVTFQLCNILDGLPYEDNTFDFVHMRQLIVALRAKEWPAVLNEIYRVLKPGGLVQLVESDFTVCDRCIYANPISLLTLSPFFLVMQHLAYLFFLYLLYRKQVIPT